MEIKTETIKEKISELFWCFVVFSILGMLMEMLFCYITTGVIESRQGLVWGPFCPIYGVGAVIGILVLDSVKESRVKLFINGAILGGIVEYVISYMLEAIYGTRFWDYTYLNYNLNGRICILYSIFWGMLAVVVMRKIDPLFRKLASQIQKRKITKIIEGIIFGFLVIDALSTVWAVNTYKMHAKSVFYGQEEANYTWYKVGRTIFTDKFMLKSFPNIRFITNDGQEIYIKNVLQRKD